MRRTDVRPTSGNAHGTLGQIPALYGPNGTALLVSIAKAAGQRLPSHNMDSTGVVAPRDGWGFALPEATQPRTYRTNFTASSPTHATKTIPITVVKPLQIATTSAHQYSWLRTIIVLFIAVASSLLVATELCLSYHHMACISDPDACIAVTFEKWVQSSEPFATCREQGVRLATSAPSTTCFADAVMCAFAEVDAPRCELHRPSFGPCGPLHSKSTVQHRCLQLQSWSYIWNGISFDNAYIGTLGPESSWFEQRSQQYARLWTTVLRYVLFNVAWRLPDACECIKLTWQHIVTSSVGYARESMRAIANKLKIWLYDSIDVASMYLHMMLNWLEPSSMGGAAADQPSLTESARVIAQHTLWTSIWGQEDLTGTRDELDDAVRNVMRRVIAEPSRSVIRRLEQSLHERQAPESNSLHRPILTWMTPVRHHTEPDADDCPCRTYSGPTNRTRIVTSAIRDGRWGALVAFQPYMRFDKATSWPLVTLMKDSAQKFDWYLYTSHGNWILPQSSFDDWQITSHSIHNVRLEENSDDTDYVLVRRSPLHCSCLLHEDESTWVRIHYLLERIRPLGTDAVTTRPPAAVDQVRSCLSESATIADVWQNAFHSYLKDPSQSVRFHIESHIANRSRACFTQDVGDSTAIHLSKSARLPAQYAAASMAHPCFTFPLWMARDESDTVLFYWNLLRTGDDSALFDYITAAYGGVCTPSHGRYAGDSFATVQLHAMCDNLVQLVDPSARADSIAESSLMNQLIHFWNSQLLSLHSVSDADARLLQLVSATDRYAQRSDTRIAHVTHTLLSCIRAALYAVT